jgi:hypothetical protein
MSADDEHIDHGDDETIDLDAEFEEVANNLNDARRKFLDASTSFGSEGERFTTIVKAQLKRLEESKRALAIQDGARAAAGEINHFSSTHANLAGQVSLLLLGLDIKIAAAQLKMLAGSGAAFALPPALTLGEAIHKQLENLNAQQRENVAIVTSAILLGHRVAEAVRAATQPIVMRQATLEQAAHDLAPEEVAKPEGVGAVVSEVVAGEVKWAFLEEVLKQTVLETATHIPLAGIVVSIGKVASDVRARQVALKKRYELERRLEDAQFVPGPLDVMFNLPAQLRDEDQITGAVVALTQQLIDVLSDFGDTE